MFLIPQRFCRHDGRYSEWCSGRGRGSRGGEVVCGGVCWTNLRGDGGGGNLGRGGSVDAEDSEDG